MGLFSTQDLVILEAMTLPAISTVHHRLALLSLDLAPSLAGALGLDLSVSTNEVWLKQLLETLIQSLAPAASGIVLDPVYAYDLSLLPEMAQTGLIMRLEKLTTEIDPVIVPNLIPNWGVANVRQHYAWAKFELFYHPSEAKALEKKQLLAELADYCQFEGIGLMLKLRIFSPTDQPLTAAQFQMDQLTAVQEFAKFSQVMALEHPLDALACATLTAELDQPWILSLTGNKTYSELKDQLRMALDNGAQGFVVAEALWPELYQLRTADDHSLDLEAMKQLIQTTIRDRFIELARIADESGTVA